ncbi:MAG: hypothetical protein OXH22_02325 [Chloroflexi bacterium]|nr:hypothetical protein [Chloroflexota bacterium]
MSFDNIDLFPVTAAVKEHDHLSIGGCACRWASTVSGYNHVMKQYELLKEDKHK